MSIATPNPARELDSKRGPQLDQRHDELASLIVATGNGDRDAFRRLYLKTSPKLLGVITRIVRSRPDAEEIAQEVYLRVWGKAKWFSPEAGSAMGWLIAIARNCAIDHIRAKGAASGYSEALELTPEIALASNPESGLHARNVLSKCLETLEPAQREMVLLAYVNGCSREELAHRFDKPVNTIKTWLHRALERLKACCEDSS